MSVWEHCEDRQDPSGVPDGRHPVCPDHGHSSRKARGVPGSQVLDLRLQAIGGEAHGTFLPSPHTRTGTFVGAPDGALLNNVLSVLSGKPE